MANNPKLKMQEAVEEKKLSFIDFQILDKWFVSYYINPHFIKSQYPLIKLKNLIKPSKEKIKLKEYKGDLRVVKKIAFNDGLIHLREENETKMDLYILHTNDLLVSKINFHQGALSINKSEKLVCTTHYQPYITNRDLVLDDYLVMALRNKKFQNHLDFLRAEGIKNEATYEFIGELEIPLPSLAEQEKIVEAYQNKIAKAQALKTQANNLETEIEKYFLEQLGMEKSETKEIKTGLQIFEFANIDRWDVWVNKNSGSDGTFKPVPFKSIVIGKPVYGANVKGVKQKSDTRYIRITDINENGSLNDEFVSPEFVEEKYLLKENDFLIARSGNTVGKTFLFKEKYGRAIYAGYLVKYNIDYSKVIPEYLFEYTKSYTFKNWVNSNQRIAGQPNINGQEYLEAPFIIPPMPIQKEIVKKITEKKKAIQEIVKEIELLKPKAEQEFEKKIFYYE